LGDGVSNNSCDLSRCVSLVSYQILSLRCSIYQSREEMDIIDTGDT